MAKCRGRTIPLYASKQRPLRATRRVLRSGRAVAVAGFAAVFEPTFADVLFGLFGPRWRQEAPRVLGYSRRQVQRWASGAVQPPRRVWVLLGRRAVTARSAIEAWAEREHERIDEVASQRLAAAAGALTALKLLGIRGLSRSRPTDGPTLRL